MDPERQAIARRVLLRLTQPGEGAEDTRRPGRATGAGHPPRGGGRGRRGVVNALAEARLVTTGRDEVTGEPVVEVTHEALIRGWPELRGWIDEDRDRLRAERRLSDAAAEWDRGRPRRGRPLPWRPPRRLGRARHRYLTLLEREFLAASTERAGRERAARPAAGTVPSPASRWPWPPSPRSPSSRSSSATTPPTSATSPRSRAARRPDDAARERDPESARCSPRTHTRASTVQVEDSLREGAHRPTIAH